MTEFILGWSRTRLQVRFLKTSPPTRLHRESPVHRKTEQPIPQSKLPDALHQTSADTNLTFKRRQQEVDEFWANYSDLVSIAAAPLLSLFFWFFYRRAGFNYTELLVTSLYMIGFTNLVFAVIVSPL